MIAIVVPKERKSANEGFSGLVIQQVLTRVYHSAPLCSRADTPETVRFPFAELTRLSVGLKIAVVFSGVLAKATFALAVAIGSVLLQETTDTRAGSGSYYRIDLFANQHAIYHATALAHGTWFLHGFGPDARIGLWHRGTHRHGRAESRRLVTHATIYNPTCEAAID